MNDEKWILIVEDDVLIAMDLEDELADHGHVTGCARSVAQALQMLDANTPSFAILDMQLQSETSFDVAARLMDMGVPYVFVSGNDATSLPDHLRASKIITKPVRSADVLAEIDAINAPRSN